MRHWQHGVSKHENATVIRVLSTNQPTLFFVANTEHLIWKSGVSQNLTTKTIWTWKKRFNALLSLTMALGQTGNGVRPAAQSEQFLPQSSPSVWAPRTMPEWTRWRPGGSHYAIQKHKYKSMPGDSDANKHLRPFPVLGSGGPWSLLIAGRCIA